MAEIVMKSVFSSTVDKVGYDSDTKELHVLWTTGKTSIYSGVSAAEAEDVSKAWSVGQAINEQIKPRYQHRYA